MENIYHPAHYTQVNGLECYEVVKHFPFTEGAIIKYLWRWRDKNGVEDLKKARWYLEELIKENDKR